jgi:CheY-like chemotaxis protein
MITALVVDDNNHNSEILSRRLAKRGMGVTVQEGGQEALNVLKEMSFDLIIMDLCMPDMSGVAAIEAIKSDTKTKDIPIICFTASIDELEYEKALTAGAIAVLEKMGDISELLALIARILPGQGLKVQ